MLDQNLIRRSMTRKKIDLDKDSEIRNDVCYDHLRTHIQKLAKQENK